MPNEYYSFKRGEWRFIILNTNEIASYSNIVGTWKENELEEIKNKILKVSGQNAVEYNGGISSRQLQWLQKLLVNSENSSEKVLIFSHHPLDCVNGLTALNSKEIISLVSKFNCVKVLIAGHHHEGFICERNPLPLIVIEGMVETAYQNSYGIIELFPDKLILNGYGRMTSKIIRFESNNFVCFY
jgi:3',5'-cyclic AMP phosphodiesterase CpdA